MRMTYERINAGDVEGFGDLVADQFVEHQGGPGFPPTKDGTLDFFRNLAQAFPDLCMTVEDLFASGDRAVARVRVSGTHMGEFMGVAPTASRADVELIDIMRFDGSGLVCEHWGVADMLSLMQQLGVVPASAPAQM
jgi:predicted ester cyclase